MKYNILINQKVCLEQKLSLKAACLLDLFSELSTWANPETFEDGVYYEIAYNKIITDLPLVFQKKDTVYRFMKELKEKGLIEQCKKGKSLKNYVRLSSTSKHLLRFGKKSEASQGSEIYPSRFGKKSEPQNPPQTPVIPINSVQGSEIYPTYNNNTIINNIYIDFLAYQFLQKNAKERIDIWEMQNKKSIQDYSKFLEYFEIKVEEEKIEFDADKLMGRLKRLKFNWNPSGLKTSNSFNDQPVKKAKRIG